MIYEYLWGCQMSASSSLSADVKRTTRREEKAGFHLTGNSKQSPSCRSGTGICLREYLCRIDV